MRIAIGDTVELNNGEVHTVEEMTPSSKGDPLWCDQSGFGPFIIGGVLYHQDGRFSNLGQDNDLSVSRIISRASDTPKPWRNMTDAEKVALLLAHHEGKVIETFDPECPSHGWLIATRPNFGCQWFAYRVKPGHVREVVEFTDKHISFKAIKGHRITFETVDGKPDCSTIKMEELD